MSSRPISFNEEKKYDGINVEAKISKDASGHDIWEVTVMVGDEDGTFVNDSVRMKRFVKFIKRSGY